MDHVKRVAAEMRAYCEAHADPKMVEKYSRYFKEGFDGWGVDKDDPYWSKYFDEWLAQLRPLGWPAFVKLGELAFSKGKYEEGGMAIRLAKSWLDEMDAKAFADLGRWFEAGIANWAHTDVLCGEILSPLLERGKVKLDVLADWRKSKLRFQRRAVPVAMLGLIKKEKSHQALLEFTRPMMLDEERVVHQGLGWFLRETWKKSPKPVEKFLLEFKDTAARLIFQYATEKMSREEKERFRAAKRKR